MPPPAPHLSSCPAPHRPDGAARRRRGRLCTYRAVCGPPEYPRVSLSCSHRNSDCCPYLQSTTNLILLIRASGHRRFNSSTSSVPHNCSSYAYAGASTRTFNCPPATSTISQCLPNSPGTVWPQASATPPTLVARGKTCPPIGRWPPPPSLSAPPALRRLAPPPVQPDCPALSI